MLSNAARGAQRGKLNHHAVYAYAGAMAGLAAVFILFNLARRIGRSSKPSALAGLSRKARSVLLRKVPLLPSGGHAFFVISYMAINLAITFTNIDTTLLPFTPNVGSRAAWMAVANLVVVVFLALKNTPLAFLTPWSYERLNILHQVAGSSLVMLIIIHASCYSSSFVSSGRAVVLTERQVIYGQVAGVSFLICAFAGAVIRRWWYELFYIIHTTFWMLAVVMVGFHQPNYVKGIVVVAMVSAGIWILDRMVRMGRLLLYSTNNSVVLTPLPNGGTRVTLKKAPVGAVSGEHCFLWIPKIRTFETHPFTIASMDPPEFVVASYDGFTLDLHKYAVKNPGVTLKGSVEGSYGTLPDPTQYDTVVFVAGGSGSSFTFGMALNMLKKLRDDAQKTIIFVWVVKYDSHLTWNAAHLDTLETDGRVDLQLYVTRSSQSGEAETQAKQTRIDRKSSEADLEGQAGIVNIQRPSSGASLSSEKWTPYETDSTKQNGTSRALAHVYEGSIRREKPDVPGLIRAAVDATPTEKRVLVLGCGPDGLMTQVRNTTASCIRRDGPGVELHCEQFGW